MVVIIHAWGRESSADGDSNGSAILLAAMYVGVIANVSFSLLQIISQSVSSVAQLTL